MALAIFLDRATVAIYLSLEFPHLEYFQVSLSRLRSLGNGISHISGQSCKSFLHQQLRELSKVLHEEAPILASFSTTQHFSSLVLLPLYKTFVGIFIACEYMYFCKCIDLLRSQQDLMVLCCSVSMICARSFLKEGMRLM